ncbi:hypothetical protein GCM10010185_66370 [Saccharothrix coeruleofusca]|uniref:DUF397 domain-containing protein n=1 Tax=Saccharothrix coeruleofusca TaxID=33919 RepID=A0A918EGQ0_9PSEU|nr:DUF397 domain-containing protein [Saccharothrix coeruleofusca]GGP83140.1 hypothetical protein GCM10010185_66370 [Saccharothrix coeruleofusca]
MTPALEPPRWSKSSRSNANGGDCVEVANTLDALRDSKNPDGPVLTWTPAALAAFFADVRSGRLG